MTPAAIASKTTLPAGPPLPTPLQAAIWALRPLELMDRCEARYGEIFTLRIRRGRPWVLLTNPAHVKQVFTRASELMGGQRGEACWFGEESLHLLRHCGRDSWRVAPVRAHDDSGLRCHDLSRAAEV